MNATRKRFLSIVFGGIGLACLLGICVDVVTANIAVEYFTVYHPHVVDSESPWVMAIVWGILATWWAGAIAGVILGAINHRREQPLKPRRILRWVAIACVVLWVLMIAVLIAVYAIASTIPVESRHDSFSFDRRIMSVAVAHQCEYFLAAIALAIVAVKTWRANPTDLHRSQLSAPMDSPE